MTPELRAALDNSFQVFGRYKDEFQMARACGIDRPLRLITHDDWRKMNAKFDISVLLWSDDAILWRHFLPLWMEWMSKDDDDNDILVGIWLSGNFSSRLKHAEWLKWPVVEVEAVRRVLEAWTHEVLADPDGRMFPHLLLKVEEDVSPYFDLWLDARPAEVAHWLLEQDWAHPTPSLLRWALKPYVEERLEAEFWAAPDETDTALFSRLIELVRLLR